MKRKRILKIFVYILTPLGLYFLIGPIWIRINEAKMDAINDRIQKEGTGFVFSEVINKKFPESNFVTVFNRALRESETNQTIKVINFWYTRCAPCIQELPELNQLVRDYDSTDVVFIAFTPDDNITVKKFLTEYQFDYHIIPDSRQLIKEIMPVMIYPTHLVVNNDGKIIYSNSGFKYNEVRYVLDSLKSSPE
jgi:peroxiredoxin